MTPAEQISYSLREKVSALSTALMTRHPTMPTLLREIHTTLSKYPEQVTLMSEDEISVIVNGLKVQTGVEFAVASVSSKAKSITGKIKAMGEDAF